MSPDPLDVALGYPDPPQVPPSATAGDHDGTAETVVAAEALLVGTEWLVTGRVRVRRRIVIERRSVEVDVRREVLEIDGDDVDFRDGRLFGTGAGSLVGAAPGGRPPIEVVLCEEVPRVVHEIRPYERVTVTVERTTRAATVVDTVRREVVDVDTLPPTH